MSKAIHPVRSATNVSARTEWLVFQSVLEMMNLAAKIENYLSVINTQKLQTVRFTTLRTTVQLKKASSGAVYSVLKKKVQPS